MPITRFHKSNQGYSGLVVSKVGLFQFRSRACAWHLVAVLLKSLLISLSVFLLLDFSV